MNVEGPTQGEQSAYRLGGSRRKNRAGDEEAVSRLTSRSVDCRKYCSTNHDKATPVIPTETFRFLL